jgi:hypothetical protein
MKRGVARSKIQPLAPFRKHRLVLLAIWVFISVTPTYQAEDWDNDGYDDETGEWIGDPYDSYYDSSFDSDGDGYDDLWEWSRLLHPGDPENLTSWSSESLPDEFAHRYPELSAYGDEDGDGLLNGEEFVSRTDPFLADTDSDGLSDGDEINGFEGFLPDR